MNIIFHRYGNICEPDILQVFKDWGLQVFEDDLEITQKNIPADIRIQQIADILYKHKISFIFSINYFPYLSEICERFHILYVCWSVDCPVLELFSKTVKNACNRIFLFDYAQYQRFWPANPDCIFYLPLAANVERLDSVRSSITDNDIAKYSAQVAFVGSLYNHNTALKNLVLSEHGRGYLDGIMNAQYEITNCNIIEELLTPSILTAAKKSIPCFPCLPDSYENMDAYTFANYYINPYISSLERIRTLRYISVYPLSLYTRSDTSPLSGSNISFKGGVSTLTELPKVFHLSKINLNITIRSIQTGIPQRIWDVLGCQGFLLTNYREELSEYFEIGRDLDCYETLEELNAKIDYYLSHDDERREIALHGYQTVKQHHTWHLRMASMLQIINRNL